MSDLSFLHAGSFGDTIYSLPAIKSLGGGDLYVQLNGMDAVSRQVWGSPDSGDHAGRYTQADLDFMFPLLERQSCIKNLVVWKDEHVDHDLRRHYDHWADKTAKTGKYENWQGNITEVYGLACGLDIHQHRGNFLINPWLDHVEPIRIPGKPIIINRTPRHTRRAALGMPLENEQWNYWLEQEHLEETAVFVGSEAEHAAFCRTYNCHMAYRPVTDMLELARLIQGCEQFMGNQSMPLSLAIGLGKTFWCEVRVDYEHIKTAHGYGDVWFPRANGHYF
jgi:hypothetical protein